MIRTLPLLLLFVHVACAAQTRLAEPARIAIEARHAGRTVELRQSCYYGDLYDDNKKWLLSPQPFAEVSHIVDLDGAPIHPRNQRGIIPAGTRFVIQRIEFPDVYAMGMRMLTTPRYNPWIYLGLTPDAAGLPTERTHFILLLPMDQEREAEVEASIAELLAAEGEVTAWLATRAPTVQVAIKHKQLVEGMEQADLVAAMGPPAKWYNDRLDDRPAQVAWYPGGEAWLVDGRVVRLAPARPEPPPAPAPAPAPAAPPSSPSPPAQPEA